MDELKGVIDQVVTQQVAAGGFPSAGGLAVCVIRADDDPWVATSGLRERDRGLPVTPTTRFELCSLTKAFTALTARTLAAQQGLGLDAPLASRTSQFRLADPERRAALSLRDVLAHRAGVPAHDLFWYLAPRTPDELSEALARMPGIEGGFRSTFVYGNALYGLLGHAFPELFGVPWQEAISTQLTGPLGFSGPRDDVALPYIGMGRARDIDTRVIAAAGGLAGSIEELGRWLALWTHQGRDARGTAIAAPEHIVEALTPHMPARDVNPLLLHGLSWLDGEPLSYGLGWFLGNRRAERVAFHPGFIDGYSHLAVLLPERSLAFAVLTNVNFTALPGALVGALLDALSDDHRQPPSHAPDAAVGHYRSELFGTATVRQEGASLFFEHRGHRWPFTRTAGDAARIDVTAFGLPIPLEAKLEPVAGGFRLHVPLALDPRIPPAVFEPIAGQ